VIKPDPAAVREALETIESVCAVWHADETYGLTAREWAACQLVRDAYLGLTDPAPLTVEPLVEMGGTRSETWLEFPGNVSVKCYNPVGNPMPPGAWIWYAGGQPLWQGYPRSAGELAMLLAMMEGR